MYMEEYSIKFIEDLVTKMGTDYKKVIAVIRSMENIIHINSVRRYVDLYYKKNGIKHQKMIEYYFKVKKRNL